MARVMNNLKQMGLASHNYESSSLRVKTALLARGMSMGGVSQFLSGEVVESPGDRKRLAEILDQLSAANQTSAVAMLLPAVQKAPEAAARSRLRKLGISATSEQQLLAGLAVTDEDDRQILSYVVTSKLGGSRSSHPGGINAVLADGSVRLIR